MRVNIKEVSKKYTELWNGFKNETETINGGKKGEYGKDFMKVNFDTDDNLPLNKQLTFDMLAIIIRSVYEEGFIRNSIQTTVFMNYKNAAIQKN